MAYKIKIHREAKRKLQSLTAQDRLRITDKIMDLGLDPDDPLLDIKPLSGNLLWRLRVGEWRIIFDRQDEVRIISVERIRSRGDVYK